MGMAFDMARLAGMVEYDPCDCCGSAGGCLCSSKMCSTCRFCETHCACARARCNGCPATYDPQWAGTTCSVCDGDILPVGKAPCP